MGGPGSGRWKNIETRGLTESYTRLDVHRLLHQGLLESKTAGILEDTGLHYLTLEDKIILWDRTLIQYIGLDWIPCPYGGVRPLFICPTCGRKVWHLYDAETRWECRHCHGPGLSYAVCNENTCQQGLRRLRKIFKKMGYPWHSLFTSIPSKKPGMHTRIYTRLKYKYMWKVLEYLSLKK